jgi:prepilin-type N-terminal cleavage/methylation domain-containing protein
MKAAMKSDRAFTLVEMLLVIAVIGILAGLLLTALSAAKGNASRTTCLDNLKQINAGIRMYCDDASDVAPGARVPWILYKERMKNYVGVEGRSSSHDRIFACPADTFHYCDSLTNGYLFFTNAPLHDDKRYDYTSYWFSGFNLHPTNNDRGQSWLGIGGLKLSSIKEPSRTVLAAEAPAFFPFSWHQPATPRQVPPGEWPSFNDAKDMVSFVDGHVSYIKMYFEYAMAPFYNPPAGYDYKWSGD